MIQTSFGPQVCGDLTAGATREWLLADGRGGYATGTVSGLRTRRYHGLLVVASGWGGSGGDGDTPASRRVGLASLDPVLILPSGAEIRLGTHEWASGAIAPAGYTSLARFDLIDGLPRWRWRVGEVVLEYELATVHGRPGVAAVFRLLAGGPVRLAAEALCTWRDAHGERTAAGPPPVVEQVAGGVMVEDAYRLAGPGWQPAGEWWHGVHYREEAARGLNPHEDLWYAGRFTATLDRPGATAEVVGWAGPPVSEPATRLVEAARHRNRTIARAGGVAGTLALAADAFVVTTGAGHPDVVAGYPWFGAWSRDTMISYPGLFLATGRVEEGRALLRGYAATLSEGMLANTADTGQTEYNTADATLWYVHAVDRHVALTGDTDLAAELLPALDRVIEAHVAGTRYGIGVDPADGLLRQGAPGEALTWMDARVDGVPITPRAGKAVEINALWVNALAAVGALSARVGRDAGVLPVRHATARDAFRAAFPVSGSSAAASGMVAPAPDRTGGLYDVVGDPAVRPNQLFAYSLPYAPMDPDPAAVRAVGAALLTPLGLRTLAATDPAYIGAHRGDPAGRDGAYHQGTVWPWLIGPYADACRRAGIDTDGLLDGLVAHLREWGLGSVSETADGDAPHAATGCPFQAWSVAETTRLYMMATQKPSEVTESTAG